MVGELAVYTPGEPVVMYQDACIHEIPPVRSPVMQATRFRIVYTWDIVLPYFLRTTSNSTASSQVLKRASQVDWSAYWLYGRLVLSGSVQSRISVGVTRDAGDGIADCARLGYDLP